MPYQVNYWDNINNDPITVEDQTVNNETSLTFVGKNYTGYSKIFADNLLHLLENFASSDAPPNPVKGQLWYDTDLRSATPTPLLKIWDGISWAETGNIKKSTSKPQRASIGDLWVDTLRNQVFLCTYASLAAELTAGNFVVGNEYIIVTVGTTDFTAIGASTNSVGTVFTATGVGSGTGVASPTTINQDTTWLLVGPDLTETADTGFKVDTIVDTNGSTRVIVKILIQSTVVVIFNKSTDSFNPKITIPGFTTIKPGININSTIDKFWGTAEKAQSLLVGNATVQASNFLRSDAISTTNYNFNIRNNTGLAVGSGLSTTLSIKDSNEETILYNSKDGSSIFLRINDNGPRDVLTVSKRKVGINNINPTTELDVTGNILNSGTIKTTNTTPATSTASAALVVSGGVGVGKNLRIGETLTVGGSITSASIFPITDNVSDLGNSTKRWRSVYANEITARTFYGTFSGQFTGSVVGSASQLNNSVPFKISGDVSTSQDITYNFDGTQSEINLVVSADSSLILNKPNAVTTNDPDNDILLINQGPSLRKISKSSFLSNVGILPIGTILPYAGIIGVVDGITHLIPDGFLLCDGSEISVTAYEELFNKIRYIYKSQSLLQGENTFALPDLRGRFPLGRDNMDNNTKVDIIITGTGVTRNLANINDSYVTFDVEDANVTSGPFQVGKQLSGTGIENIIPNPVVYSVSPNTPSAGITRIRVNLLAPLNAPLSSASNLTLTSVGEIDAGGGSANRVTNIVADSLGGGAGSESVTLVTNNLPEHSHDLQSTSGSQFYAFRNVSASQTINTADTAQVIQEGGFKFSDTNAGIGHYLSNSGGIVNRLSNTVTEPFTTMNPYLTINYIIYTGKY